MSFVFRWNKQKARRNIKNHHVTFEEATTVFGDTLSRTIEDPLHSTSEDRWVIIGESNRRRLLVVVHVVRGDMIRIISARVATAHERKNHEEGYFDSR